MTNFLLLLILLLPLISCNPNSDSHSNLNEVAQQQVIPGELPDPSVIEVNGVYYASGSSNDWGPLYPIYKSTDLVHWSFVNYVFAQPPAWTMSSFWAPELFYHKGVFYCYYTARRKDGISCLGVATTQNIEAGFQDRGLLLEWGNEAIDAFVYPEDDTLYITWKAYGLTPGKSIQILGAELAPDGLSVKGKPFEMLTAERTSWEKGGIEGQSIFKKGDYLYMLYSGNACCGGSCDYKVGVARARSMKGPWEKYQQNPVLDGNATWKCPGHGTALKTTGKWYYLYHAYHQKGFPYLGRSAILSQMFWNEETAWPYFKADADSARRTVLKQDVVDHFNSENLETWWRYDVPGYTFKADIDQGELTLAEVERNNQVGAAIGISPDYADFTMRTKITENTNALKGLVLYATGTNSVGLGVKGDSLVLWKVKDGNFIELNKINVTYNNAVFLRANVSEGHLATFYYSKEGKEWVPVMNEMENKDMVKGDNLAWWSWGVKAGLFVKTDSISGENRAVFDEFSITYE